MPPKKPPRKRLGRKPERLKLTGNWEDAMAKMLTLKPEKKGKAKK